MCDLWGIPQGRATAIVEGPAKGPDSTLVLGKVKLKFLITPWISPGKSGTFGFPQNHNIIPQPLVVTFYIISGIFPYQNIFFQGSASSCQCLFLRLYLDNKWQINLTICSSAEIHKPGYNPIRKCKICMTSGQNNKTPLKQQFEYI